MSTEKKILSRDEQRARNMAGCMLSFQLGLHLRNLADEIMRGDATLLPEFQQMIQFAPPQMRASMIDYIHAPRVR